MRRSLRAEASMTPGLLMVIVPIGSLKVKYFVENLYMYSDSAAPPVEGSAIATATANAARIRDCLAIATSLALRHSTARVDLRAYLRQCDLPSDSVAA